MDYSSEGPDSPWLTSSPILSPLMKMSPRFLLEQQKKALSSEPLKKTLKTSQIYTHKPSVLIDEPSAECHQPSEMPEIEEEKSNSSIDKYDLSMETRTRTVSFGVYLESPKKLARTQSKDKDTISNSPGRKLSEAVVEEIPEIKSVLKKNNRSRSMSSSDFNFPELGTVRLNRAFSMKADDLPCIQDELENDQANNEVSFDICCETPPNANVRSLRRSPRNRINTLLSPSNRNQANNRGTNDTNLEIREPPRQEGQSDVDEHGRSFEERTRILDEILFKLAVFKFRRAMVLSTAVFLASLNILFLLQGSVSHRSLFLIGYAFFIYYLTECIIKVRTPDILPWKKFENIFDTLDIFYLVIYMIFVDINLSGFELPTKFNFIVPLLTTIVYFCKSKAPKALKESQTAIRALYSLQFLVLSSRVDGDLDWPWRVIIGFFWLYVGLISIYCVLVAITLVCVAVLTYLKTTMYENIDGKTQIIGFLWSTLYSGFGVLLFLGLVGVCIAYDPNENGHISYDKTLIIVSVIIAQFLSILLIVYSVVARSLVLDFLEKFNLDEPDYKAHLGLEIVEDNLPKIITEKKDTYLVMLSSTYFQSLKNSYYMTGKDSLRRLRKAIKQAKQNRFKRNHGTRLDEIKNKLKSSGKISIQALKREKEGLDKVYGEKEGKIDIVVVKNSTVDQTKSRRYSSGFLGADLNLFRAERKESNASSCGGNGFA